MQQIARVVAKQKVSERINRHVTAEQSGPHGTFFSRNELYHSLLRMSYFSCDECSKMWRTLTCLLSII